MNSYHLDGFVVIDPSKDVLAEHNLRPQLNEISPFCRFPSFSFRKASEGLIVDKYYGLAYDFEIPPEAAIYGVSDELPSYSGDIYADLGFLRVPFRRVPRIRVRSRRHLEEIIRGIVNPDPDLVLLYRGQHTEYPLRRSPETLRALYGDENAREPSLLASSARSGTKLEDVLPEWMSTLMAYLGVTADAERNLQNAASRYAFSLFALALAQHYGLPSVGLDVTTDFNVALFFALTKLDPKGAGSQAVTCRRKNPADGDSVLYILAPNEAYQLNYDDFRPPGFRALRPERQAARFMHEGWGLRENAAAHQLFMALYLDPSGDFDPIPPATDLFPAASLDRFSEHLQRLCALQGLPARFQQFLQRYYFVE